MARKPTQIPMNEGYPVRNTHDGIDTDRTIGGAMKELLQVERSVSTWTNSKTGEPMEKPDYVDD